MTTEYNYHNTTIDSEANNNECAICKDEKNFKNWIKCCACKCWFHHRCLGITVKETKKLTRFVCLTCPEPSTSTNDDMERDKSTEAAGVSNSQPTNLSNQIFAQELDGEQLDLTDCDYNSTMPDSNDENSEPADSDATMDTDEEGNSEVTSITGHRQKGKQREYQVTFRKDKSTTWILEKNLTNCPALLEKYCEEYKIDKPSFLKNRRLGSISPEEANRDNWATVEDIIKMVKTHGDKNPPLAPKQFIELGQENAIYLMPVADHCFTILYLASKGTCFVADGQNAFLKDKLLRKVVLSKFKAASSIHYIEFDRQTRIDHCASSAAVIAIEFQRMVRTGQIPNLKQVPASTLNRIKSALHPGPSKSVDGRFKVHAFQWGVKCPKCGVILKTKNRGHLNLHKC